MRLASRSTASKIIIGSSVRPWALIQPGIKEEQQSKIHCRVPHPLERGINLKNMSPAGGHYKQLLRSSRRNVSPVELIDGPFLLCHEDLSGALIECREIAKTSSRANGVLHHAPEAFDVI